MKLTRDRVLTTHAGSLPRPDDLAKMLYDVVDEKAVDADALRRRTREAVADVVKRQRDLGIDAVSDGEMGKVGFSNYVIQHLSGFSGSAQGVFSDMADVPDVMPQVFGSEAGQHFRLPV